MNKATELTDQLEAALRQVPGFTNVYPQGSTVPDKAPMPYLLLRIVRSEAEGVEGVSIAYGKRVETYEVEAVYSRSATIADFQAGSHAILTGIGFGKHQNSRAVKAGTITEQSTEFPEKEEGSLHQSMTLQIAFQYAETY